MLQHLHTQVIFLAPHIIRCDISDVSGFVMSCRKRNIELIVVKLFIIVRIEQEQQKMKSESICSMHVEQK